MSKDCCCLWVFGIMLILLFPVQTPIEEPDEEVIDIKIGQFEEIENPNADLAALNNFKNLAEYNGTYWFIKDIGNDPYVASVVGLTGETVTAGANRTYNPGADYVFQSAISRSFGDDIYLSAAYWDGVANALKIINFHSLNGGVDWEDVIMYGLGSILHAYSLDIFKIGDAIYHMVVYDMATFTRVAIFLFDNTGVDYLTWLTVDYSDHVVSGYCDGTTYWFLIDNPNQDATYISLYKFTVADDVEYVESIGITVASVTTWNVYHQLYWKQGNTEIFMCEDFLKSRTNNGIWQSHNDVGSTTNAVIWYKDASGNYIINDLVFKDTIFEVGAGGAISPLQTYTGSAYVGYKDWFSNGVDKIYQFTPTTTKNALSLDLCYLKLKMLTGSFKELNAKDVWAQDELVHIYDDNNVLLAKMLVIASNKINRTVTLKSPATIDLDYPITIAVATNLSTVLDDNLGYCTHSVPVISIPACNDKPLRVILRESVINGGYVWYITGDLVLTVNNGTTLVSNNSSADVEEYVTKLKARYLPQSVGAVKVIYKGNESVTAVRTTVGGVLLVYNFPSIPTSALATTKAEQIRDDTNKTIIQISCIVEDLGIFQQGMSVKLTYSADADLETSLANEVTYYIIKASYDEEMSRVRLILQDARAIPRPRLTAEILDNKIDNNASDIADNVHNPMTVNLDGGGKDITNLGDVTLASDKYIKSTTYPAFAVAQSSSQSIPNNVATKITWNIEETDLGSNFASNKFTAPVDGYYHLDVSILFTDAGWVNSERILLFIYKNGVNYKVIDRWECQDTETMYVYLGNGLGLELNATDYVEVYILHNQGSAVSLIGSSLYNHFTGHLVRRL